MSAHFAIKEWGNVTLVTPITPEATAWVAEHMPDLHHIGDGIPFGHEGAATFISTVLADLGEPPAPIPAVAPPAPKP